MRRIGKEMITFGVGLPVLYVGVVGMFLNGHTTSAMLSVAAVSFLMIALGREVRVRGAKQSK